MTKPKVKEKTCLRCWQLRTLSQFSRMGKDDMCKLCKFGDSAAKPEKKKRKNLISRGVFENNNLD